MQDQEYIATFRAAYTAQTDAQANLIAETIIQASKKILDEDDSDSYESDMFVTQVTNNAPSLEPTEVIIRLRQCRNDLIRSGFKECWDLARELDKIQWSFKRRLDPAEGAAPDYDWGEFMDVARRIIDLKENPL
ncbi:hypothetical protein UFOVP1537_28 [uncultured Caudovirales phage]|uniref:Uncharacterized protein n=2 Tax=root TaxID=1 RepID=A0A6J5QP54_9CAUD|nr:hypothetical protein UFOVP825_46 [uncultured Caudovirales phage]CAB4171256.1 hypothetical protein UFOVP915_28 [uncultured Caudovirales phage]CAB4177228.1 hypothetical protein UFOVP1000_45 [uncultured Caudovirales phage]CAB4182788.1 hypothetical protein UFOVP1092_20 [uncultured Caudovirales phage]CAB4187510.1 hypothetical protein UFOVP1152_24 [uncultured Caudovirales phage]